MIKKTVLLLCLCLAFLACGDKKAQIDQMLELEGKSLSQASKQRIAELKDSIDKYEDIVNKKVDAALLTGDYYKMLGREYEKAGLHKLALEAYENGLEYWTNNHVLFFYAGLNAAQCAKAEADKARRASLFEKTLLYYKRSIELDNQYPKALFAISVLLAYELDQIGQAEKYLEQLLQVDGRHIKGHFLLARIKVSQNRISEAITLYERIEKLANDEEDRKKAANLKRQLLGGGN